ncbi:RusA family crossover junction endodeoxyribonuclease [Lacticaseibacillus parakribbianus]|uniref:RusA family crossover junction endodeoxyribonuclease n=1 Tax=Lacticaseibacillus parakribbianus TaxID=2970927 RepID=UPI0021CAF71A|nr:RusA family crossover junction endodeoxyribonuclease [Lacticaseibacillus parakribbianus]
MIHLTIIGVPVPQGRPKFSARGGFARAYDPKTSRDYKFTVATQASQQYHSEPLTGPVACHVKVYRPIQKSGSKRLRAAKAAGLIRPTVKGDTDNYFKAITDALTGLVWIDDAQIVDSSCSKYYTEDPRVEITIEEIK